MNRSLSIQLIPFLKSASLKRGAIFGGILISALLAFEVFNFGTTSFALRDILGDLTFAGMNWSTLLAFAFCGIDFAGIARIFTPEQGRDEPTEVWYLFSAWLLAAGFNASLTWWGVAVAIHNHTAEGSLLVGQSAMTKIVPIMVAGMVWLIRVLIIGTFSVAGERLFTMADIKPQPTTYRNESARPAPVNQPFNTNLPRQNYPRPAPKPQPVAPAYTNRPEPSDHPVGMTAMSRNENNSSTTRR
ncbi:MAG: hypothetical protein PHQ36_06965 [Anaerolineales bacterium]|nr:hypothetical protein [Anaerolineales bacterium]